MRYAITGGAGFLGLHLARRLLADGHEVRSLDTAPLDDVELERSVEELRGDVRDQDVVNRLCDGADIVVHAAAEDLVDAIVRASTVPEAANEVFHVGAKEFGTVRQDLQALIDHAGSDSRLTPVPVKPAELILRALELARLSPLAEWHYKTAHRDSFLDVSKAERVLGWSPRLSNEQ